MKGGLQVGEGRGISIRGEFHTETQETEGQKGVQCGRNTSLRQMSEGYRIFTAQKLLAACGVNLGLV